MFSVLKVAVMADAPIFEPKPSALDRTTNCVGPLAVLLKTNEIEVIEMR